MRLLPLPLALLLVLCALSLVTSQYRTRELFDRLEQARAQARVIGAEAARLRVDLGRASQPATVEVSALRLGMRPVSPDAIVMLAPGTTDAAADLARDTR